jgi:hypothetical protein
MSKADLWLGLRRWATVLSRLGPSDYSFVLSHDRGCPAAHVGAKRACRCLPTIHVEGAGPPAPGRRTVAPRGAAWPVTNGAAGL